MVKGNVKNESPMYERGIKERNHRLGACEKTLRKAMKRKKEEWKLPTLKGKLKWNGRRMPINSKRGKRGFNWKKTQQMPKVKKKIEFHIF